MSAVPSKETPPMFLAVSRAVAVAALPVVSWFRVPMTKSSVLSLSSYVTLIPVSVLLETIAPTVSEMVSARDTPSIVMASASSVPSTSTLPEISKDDAVTTPTVIFGVPVRPSARAAVPVVF